MYKGEFGDNCDVGDAGSGGDDEDGVVCKEEERERQ